MAEGLACGFPWTIPGGAPRLAQTEWSSGPMSKTEWASGKSFPCKRFDGAWTIGPFLGRIVAFDNGGSF